IRLIGDPSEFPLEQTELAADGVNAANAELARIEHASACTAFDLKRDFPVKARLLRIGPDRHRLYLVFHHIAVDGWSLQLIVGELASRYREQSDAGGRLPPVTLAYSDYARWQKARAETADFKESAAFWQRTLATALPVIPLPTDYVRPATADLNGARAAT